MQKTAIQLALENTQTAKANSKDCYVTFDEVLEVLTDLLPAEQEQIEQAVLYGNMQDFYDGTHSIGKTYYNETYKTEE
jgi:hypothetical protein